jgi:hypothetical protein
MTKRHFIALAAIVRGNVEAVANGDEDENVHAMLETVASEIADFCGRENERFDRDKFMGACGLA